MAIEVGSVLEGTVTGITKFGAFVDLGNKQTGLVHISEVANEYVENISDFIKEADTVKVKVLSVMKKVRSAYPLSKHYLSRKLRQERQKLTIVNLEKVNSALVNMTGMLAVLTMAIAVILLNAKAAVCPLKIR